MQKLHASWLLVTLVAYGASAETVDLPEYLHVCHREDPKLTECMKESIETLRPYLARGIPELDIPSIDPIHLGDLIVAESVPGQGVSISAKDIKAYGPSNFKLKKLTVIEYGKIYSFELELPHLYVEGRYVVDGRILLLPVKGSGKFTGNFTQGIGSVRIKGDRKRINDKDHLSLAKLDIKIRVSDGRIKLENLFGGDRVLGEIINETINQNFNLLSTELIPLIEKALQRIFKRTGNKILERFPEESNRNSVSVRYRAHGSLDCASTRPRASGPAMDRSGSASGRSGRGRSRVTRLRCNMALMGLATFAVFGVLSPVIFHVAEAKEIVIRNKDVPQYQAKPEWLRVCKRANPNEDDCFKKMFEGTFPYIAKGIPEIGVQPFDPLRLESIQVSRGSGGLTLSGGFKKLSIKGPSNTTVRRAFLDFDKHALSFELEIPKLRIDASYNLKGNVLLLPLVGDGDVTMSLKNVKTTVVTKFAVRPLPEDAIFIEEMKVTFLVGGMRIHLDNLFQGNQVLGASLNLFLNQNANEVIAELRSDLEHGLADIFTGLWNELFNKLPLKLWIA
ncbi:uncharacterized protein LOC128716383 [Anopheles marshallii]|uniref:uncharacterized protein LOC128716383 n=1 Tax=Anopheles marshallii TaxID=1521116 RepID=UPI00237B776A|nr:uncharacterized protein LOC128716383 [Anopheles marshallii]